MSNSQIKVINHLSTDKILAPLINSIAFPSIKSTNNVFHDLIGCIIEQQIHYRSSKKTFKKMLNEAKINELSIDNYPMFDELSLSKKKLSQNKINALEGVLELFYNENINWSALSDKEVSNKLSEIKGIGKKTINMILIYTLERPNVFIPDDYHVQKTLLSLYPIDQSSKINKQISRYCDAWSPYKSYAFKYLEAYRVKE